jgi:hypothetical protein
MNARTAVDPTPCHCLAGAANGRRPLPVMSMAAIVQADAGLGVRCSSAIL